LAWRGDAALIDIASFGKIGLLPARPFPLGAAPGGDARLAPDGFADTGFTCRLDPATATIAVTAPPAGMTAVGGYRFNQCEINAVVVKADPAASFAALPDASLVQRLAGSARDRAATEAALRARGTNARLAGERSVRAAH
jgi:hypothetical protein